MVTFLYKDDENKHGVNINLPVFQYSNPFDDLWWSKNQFPSIDEVRVKQWVIYTGGGRGGSYGKISRKYTHAHHLYNYLHSSKLQ